jgi:hypothetical protein
MVIIKKSEIEPMVQRMENARLDFTSNVVEQFGKTQEEAEIILGMFITHKLVKLDIEISRYQIRHGSFWDIVVMNNCIDQAPKG